MTSVVPPSDEQRDEETSTTTDPIYRDFSRVTLTEDSAIQSLIAISGQQRGTSTTGTASSSSSDRNFPVRLHYILSELEADGLSYIVAWQPHGRCFIVHKQQEFVDLVLRRWFRQSQLASFQRQLNIYGFNRITFGPDKNAYYHECFLRGKLFLAQSIKRTKVKGKGPRRPGCHRTEPNFYAMPFLPPTIPNAQMSRNRDPSPELQRQLTSQGMHHNNNMRAFLNCEQQPTMNRLSLGSLAHVGHSHMMNGFGSCYQPSLLQSLMMPFAQETTAISRFTVPSATSTYVLPPPAAAAYPVQAAIQLLPLVQTHSARSDRGGQKDLASFAKHPNPQQAKDAPSLADDTLVAMTQQQSQMPQHELARAIMLESIAARYREAQSMCAAANRDVYHSIAADAHHCHVQHQSILSQLHNEEIQRFLEDATKNTIHHH